MKIFKLPSSEKLPLRERNDKQSKIIIYKVLDLAENNLIEALDILLQHEHLHGCEQEGISSGMPTPKQWLDLSDRTNDFLNKFR